MLTTLGNQGAVVRPGAFCDGLRLSDQIIFDPVDKEVVRVTPNTGGLDGGLGSVALILY